MTAVRGIHPADGVVVEARERGALLLDPTTGRYFSLNAAGVVVWDAIVAGRDPADAIGEHWPAVPEEQRRRDAEALVSALLEADLLVADDPA